MKKFLFTIATAMFAFTNVNAENFVNASEENGGSKVNDTAVVRPVSVTGDEEALEMVAAGLKITEANLEPAAPLLPGKSPEEVIADDNLVIDGGACKEIYPLDFKKINGVEQKNKKRPIKNSNERLVGSL
jgi:hypothetical protein